MAAMKKYATVDAYLADVPAVAPAVVAGTSPDPPVHLASAEDRPTELSA
jgi:hypothetical protein